MESTYNGASRHFDLAPAFQKYVLLQYFQKELSNTEQNPDQQGQRPASEIGVTTEVFSPIANKQKVA